MAIDFFGQREQIKSLQLKFEVRFLDNFGKAALVNDYEYGKRRLFLLDYDGTLVNFSKALPDQNLLDVLQNLSSVPSNDIYIVRGRDSETFNKWLGHLPIGLIAKDGTKIKYIGGSWSNEAIAESTSWKGTKWSHLCCKKFIKASNRII